MKKSLKHSILWKKRSEWQISDDAQTDWQQMQGLLDEHMPVNDRNNKGAVVKKFKLLSTLFATISAAAMLHFFTHQNEIKQHTTQPKHKTTQHHSSAIGMPDSLNTDTLGLNESDSINRVVPKLVPNNLQPKANPDKEQGNQLASNTGSGINSNSPDDSDNPLAEKGNKGSLSTSNITNKPGNNGINPLWNKTSTTGAVHNRSANWGGVNNSSVAKRSQSVLSNQTTNHASLSHNSRGIKNTGAHKSPSGINIIRNTSTTNPIRYNRNRYNNNRRHTASTANNTTKPNTWGKAENHKSQATMVMDTYQRQTVFIDPVSPSQNFVSDSGSIAAFLSTDVGKNTAQIILPAKSTDTKKTKKMAYSKLDWGILMGFNSAGSFTAQNQNANFYGSLPVDAYLGLFATYNITRKWGVNLQIKGLTAQTAAGTYSHANQSKIDTSQTLLITDSRKVYFTDIPLHLIYRVSSNISLMAGPVMSIPIKQANANSIFDPGKSRKDTTTYYATVTDTLNNTKYEQKISFGISGGVSIQYRRFIFDVTYLKALKPLNITSDLGGYSFTHDTFQFTLGFKLNKIKK